MFFPLSCLIIFSAFALISFSPSIFAQNVSAQTDQVKMMQILKRSREYCRRLSQVALDFVCMEEVSEKYIDVNQVAVRFGRGSRFQEKGVVRKHKYLYDYQFIRKDGRKIEKRILLEEDGVKKKRKKIVHSETQVVYKDYKFFIVETDVEFKLKK